MLSTLHTNDAVTSALRLLDMGAASYLVASALRVIIAQRLVRRVCHNCGVEYQPTAQEKAWLNSVSRQDFSSAKFRIGTGCQSCNGSGYRGRIGIFEILELDEKMIDAMRTGNPQDFARAALQSPNFTPLAESALQYLSEGMTTIEEVAKLVEDVSESQVPLSRDIISQQGVEA